MSSVFVMTRVPYPHSGGAGHVVLPAPGPLKPCTTCACSGVHVDYAGPGVGGVAVACKACGGRGWVPSKGG
jgi:DnaJ-class molecular chaperone